MVSYTDPSSGKTTDEVQKEALVHNEQFAPGLIP